MNWEEYQAIDRMNPSTLVNGCRSMLALRHAIERQDEDDDAGKYVLGSCTHALLLEPYEFGSRFAVMPDFKLDPKNVDAKGEPSRHTTKWVREQQAQWRERNAGKEMVEARQLEKAKAMAAAIRGHRTASMWLEVSKTEQTLLGEICGVPMKGRVDVINDSAILDVKTTASVSPTAFGNTVARLRYVFREAIYRELDYQTSGRRKDVYFIAVEDAAPWDVVVYQVPEVALDAAFRDVTDVLLRYQKSMESGEWPGVDRGEDYVQLVIPNWAMPEEEALEWGEV
jgi:hypothetical protein